MILWALYFLSLGLSIYSVIWSFELMKKHGELSFSNMALMSVATAGFAVFPVINFYTGCFQFYLCYQEEKKLLTKKERKLK